MNKDTRDMIIEAYQLIHDMDITDAAKSKLVDLVDEAGERYGAVNRSDESIQEALVRMNSATRKAQKNSSVLDVSKHMSLLERFLVKGKEKLGL